MGDEVEEVQSSTVRVFVHEHPVTLNRASKRECDRDHVLAKNVEMYDARYPEVNTKFDCQSCEFALCELCVLVAFTQEF